MTSSMWSYAKLFTNILTSSLTAGQQEWTASGINHLISSTKYVVAMSAVHFCYAMGTQEDTTIVVTHKYQFVTGGASHFMVVDERGKHYVVNNSLWFWKWDSLEDWHALCKRRPAVVHVYGWRVPIFGMFPIIVESKTEAAVIMTQQSPLRPVAVEH